MTLSNLSPAKDERRRVSADVWWNVPIVELNILNRSVPGTNTFKTLNPLIGAFHRTSAEWIYRSIDLSRSVLLAKIPPQRPRDMTEKNIWVIFPRYLGGQTLDGETVTWVKLAECCVEIISSVLLYHMLWLCCLVLKFSSSSSKKN